MKLETKLGYVSRAHRPQRALAIAALNRFLERHPDLRIGQALYALTANPFNVEDEDIIAACEADERQSEPAIACEADDDGYSEGFADGYCGGYEHASRRLTSRRGHFLLIDAKVTGAPVVTVEAHSKWYGLQVVSPGPIVSEVPFPDHDTLTPYVDHVPNPLVVKEWADANGYEIADTAMQMMVGRWQLMMRRG